MSVKGWNFKLLIVVGHGFKGGRRVRLPLSAPLISNGETIQSFQRFFNLVDTCSITWSFDEIVIPADTRGSF